MYVPFNQLSDQSKVWIYQSDRKLSDSEQAGISSELESFATQWTAHDQTLKASGDIKNNQFIVLAVDESMNSASGCSIDKSVHFIQSLEKKFNLNLFNREQLVFEVDNEIEVLSLSDLKNQINSGKINEDSVFFNNLVATLADLKTNWRVMAKESWLKKYFKEL